MRPPTSAYPASSDFQVVRTRDLAPLRRVRLKGSFSYEALSPDGSRLYLIQHVRDPSLSRYVVRAYDLVRRRLLSGRIADRAQRDWVMAGWPVTRATSAGGRWAYTLYARSGGTPFVRALDTLRGVAHCIGIPWRGVDENALWRLRLAVRDGGRTLSLHWPRGREYLAVTRGTWQISRPSAAAAGARSGFPWGSSASREPERCSCSRPAGSRGDELTAQEAGRPPLQALRREEEPKRRPEHARH